jgi:hypothetical protein
MVFDYNLGASEMNGFPSFISKSANNPSTFKAGFFDDFTVSAVSNVDTNYSAVKFFYHGFDVNVLYPATTNIDPSGLFCPLLQRVIPGVSQIELTTSDGAPIACGTIAKWTLTGPVTSQFTFNLLIFFTPLSPSSLTTAADGATGYTPANANCRFLNLAGASTGISSVPNGFQASTANIQPNNMVNASATTTLATSNYSSTGLLNSNSIYWNYTLNNVELTLDLVRPSSDVHLQYLNQFKSPMGIPYPYTRTLYYYKTIPGSFNSGTDSTILPFAVRSLKGIMVVITDPYSFGYGSDATVTNFPSKSAFMMGGLVQANLTIGG